MGDAPATPRPRLELRESFDWKWTLMGTLLMVGSAAGLYWALKPIFTYIFNTHGALAGAPLMPSL